MCLPAVIFFIVFNYCPLPGVWIAFTSYNFRDGIFGSPFVGLSNFEFLISSGELWTLTKNTILYNLVCNGVQREHNKKLNNGLPILHKVPPK